MRTIIYNPSVTVKIITITLVLLYAIAVRSCVAQSIGLSVNFAGNGVVIGGIQITNEIRKLGGYVAIVTDETDGNRKTFNSYDKSLAHLSGITAGVNYQVNDRLNLLAGAGSIKSSSYADSKANDRIKYVGEVCCTISLCRWLAINAGVNSYPMVISGITIKISK